MCFRRTQPSSARQNAAVAGKSSPTKGKPAKQDELQQEGGKPKRARQKLPRQSGTKSQGLKEPQGPQKKSCDLFPIVGLGASAGGLSALKKFFDRVPENSEFPYVVMVHLSPQHKSHLAELLQPHVKMPVPAGKRDAASPL